MSEIKPCPEDRLLLDRLHREARDISEFGRRQSQAKSLRQEGHNPPRDDLYMWATPEQTTAGKAAARIVELAAERDRASDACASVQKERDELREMLGEAARNLDALLTMNDKMNEPPPHGGVLPVDMATVMYACRAFLARYEGGR